MCFVVSCYHDLQSYDELVELASKGNDQNVNTHISDVTAGIEAASANDESNFYGGLCHSKSNFLAFYFGKAVDSKISRCFVLETVIECPNIMNGT